MAIHPILAMTGHEIRETEVLPTKIAWMACQFSPHDTGITNLPTHLPDDAMIILSDENPIHNHDPQRIADQLFRLRPGSVLLDFQRPRNEPAALIAQTLVQALPCPVGVSPPYAKEFPCPVFLPPVPPHILLEDHIRPWNGHEIWLELALDASQITITAEGSTLRPILFAEPAENPHHDERLHCHYFIREEPDALRFYLYRTREDVASMLSSVQNPNITHAIGLFQELG